jgi:hypothetical protein
MVAPRRPYFEAVVAVNNAKETIRAFWYGWSPV